MLYLRNLLQRLSYYSDQLGLHGACSFFQDKACHVQDHFIDEKREV